MQTLDLCQSVLQDGTEKHTRTEVEFMINLSESTSVSNNLHGLLTLAGKNDLSQSHGINFTCEQSSPTHAHSLCFAFSFPMKCEEQRNKYRTYCIHMG